MFRRNPFSLNPISTLLSSMFAMAACYAFDPNDPADVAMMEAAVEKATTALAKKNKELLGELKVAKKGTEIDPAAHEALERQVEDLQTQLTTATAAHKAAVKAGETASEALKGEQAFNQRLLVDNGLNAALLEAGVKNPAHLKAAAALLKTSAKVEVKVDGETRAAVVGDKSLGDFVKTWSQSDEGKAFVSAPGNSGGGANGGNGGGGQQTGNMGGTPAERNAALAARFPELAANSTSK